MGRSAFQLSDEQGRLLVAALPGIFERHPAGGRDHRPFLREFMRAVFDATGKTFSPPIYRRLMAAYAPGRKPSTDTFADEKRLLDEALAQEAIAGRQMDGQGGEELATIVRRAVQQALQNKSFAPPGQQGPHDALLAIAQRDFLQDWLVLTEAQLADVRSAAARMAADLQTVQAQRDALVVQGEENRATVKQQAQQLQQLTDELGGVRKFSMSAIDGVRGETRAWQERCAALEAKLQEERKHLEYFRQIAYQRGAAVPASLKGASS